MPDTLEHKTLTDAGYSRLRHDIIQGHFAPGQKLRIEHLRKAYDVGATPLREALHRLSAEGFVSAEGQRGFNVAELSLRELEELTDLRVMIEGQALEQSLARADDQWESEVVAAFHHLSKIEKQDNPDPLLWESRNQDFHDALISRCESQWLMRLYEILYSQHLRYRVIARSDGLLADRDLNAEHAAILEAALERDLPALLSAQEKHIRNTAMAMEPYLRRETPDTLD